MKTRKPIHSYTVQLVNEPILIKDKTFSKTACISLRDRNNILLEKKKYGIFDLDVLYEQINLGQDIDLSDSFVRNFSISDYRKKYDLAPKSLVTINNLNASNAFFEADKIVNFSNVKFNGEYTLFNNVHFGTGSLSFIKSEFNTKLVDFSNTSFGEGNNSFKFATFSKGLTTFENSSFINGNLSFINTQFNDGDTIFKNVNFGNGDIFFQFSSFGKGVVNFERTIFRGIILDFSKVDFGIGKVDFRRANFGDSEISFENTQLKDSKIVLRRAKFGKRPISFKNSELINSEIILDEAEFGTGQISFFGIIAKSISIKSTILTSYIDFRVSKCETIDVSNSIIHNVLDFKQGITAVEIDQLYIYSLRNLGKLFINWEENNIAKIIGQQPHTTYLQKSEQFRILKEDFHAMGQYDDEDKAYIEFKRNESKDIFYTNKEKGFWAKISSYFRYGFQTILFDWMGKYATSPIRVLTSIFFIYGSFSVLYVVFELTNHGQISCIDSDMGVLEKLIDSFYFSAVTFLTIGYGECVPTGFFRVIAPIEGWAGVFMMSYFTVAFVRKILR